MSTIEILRYANIGIQNDEIEISKVLKEEPFRPLKEVKLASGDRIQILFGKKVLDNESNNFIKYPKKVLQVSKETCKTVEDAENRVSFLIIPGKSLKLLISKISGLYSLYKSLPKVARKFSSYFWFTYTNWFKISL